jgi:hypothetical protein
VASVGVVSDLCKKSSSALEHPQAEIGEKLGWSRSKVNNYTTVIDTVDTEVRKLARKHQEGRVSPDDTTVSFNFTEGWFRNSEIYELSVQGIERLQENSSVQSARSLVFVFTGGIVRYLLYFVGAKLSTFGFFTLTFCLIDFLCWNRQTLSTFIKSNAWDNSPDLDFCPKSNREHRCQSRRVSQFCSVSPSAHSMHVLLPWS